MIILNPRQLSNHITFTWQKHPHAKQKTFILWKQQHKYTLHSIFFLNEKNYQHAYTLNIYNENTIRKNIYYIPFCQQEIKINLRWRASSLISSSNQFTWSNLHSLKINVKTKLQMKCWASENEGKRKCIPRDTCSGDCQNL